MKTIYVKYQEHPLAASTEEYIKVPCVKLNTDQEKYLYVLYVLYNQNEYPDSEIGIEIVGAFSKYEAKLIREQILFEQEEYQKNYLKYIDCENQHFYSKEGDTLLTQVYPKTKKDKRFVPWQGFFETMKSIHITLLELDDDL